MSIRIELRDRYRCRYGSQVADRVLYLRDIIEKGAYTEAEVDAATDSRRDCRLVHDLVIILADNNLPDLLDYATRRLSDTSG